MHNIGEKVSVPVIVFLTFVGLGLSFVTIVISAFMTGAGHGVVSPLKVSWVSFFAMPLVLIAWSLRRRREGSWLAGLALFTGLCADAAILLHWEDEANHWARVLEAGGLIWASLWLGWQVTAVAVFVAVAQEKKNEQLARG